MITKSAFIRATNVKSILVSKRASIYWLEYSRLLVNGGRAEYITDTCKRQLYWNIPITNTTNILLGTGNSMIQAARSELAKAGVLVGFCGGGDTPLFAANEMNVEVAWLSLQSEYRPSLYLQSWGRFCIDDDLQMAAAKQLHRLNWLPAQWTTRALRDAGFDVPMDAVQALVAQFKPLIAHAPSITTLLSYEARLTKALYKLAEQTCGYGDITEAKWDSGTDISNLFRDHGNYLATVLAKVAVSASSNQTQHA